MMKFLRFGFIILVFAILISIYTTNRDVAKYSGLSETNQNVINGEQLSEGVQDSQDYVEHDNYDDEQAVEVNNEEQTVQKNRDASENEIINEEEIIVETEVKGIDIKNRVVCIDPGHQQKANYDMEPIAPSSTVMKEKMSWGTMGVATGIPEYKLNMNVSLKLKKALESLGIRVIMTRETNDVNIGNIERAKMANDNNVDLVVRIHADGIDNSSVKGMSVLYPGDKYIKDRDMIARSKNAASKVLEAMVSHTGAKSRGVIKRDDLTGFNWSTVPVILVEMGFMTNPDEDKLLNSNEYQDKIVKGIVEGIEDYFESIELD